nr:hypothetical protein [Bacteroidota bacterium]
MLPFRNELFWDVKIESLDVSRHKHLIIERVITFGTIVEFRDLLRIYNADIIKESLRIAKALDPKTTSFVSWYFN